MSKWVIGILAASGIFAVFALVICLYGIGVYNKEARLRNTIVNKQKDNTSEYDSLWKKISQAAQVTDGQKQALMEIIVGYANARKGSGGGSLAQMIHEAVPNVDTSTFNNLQNIIVSSRDGWTMRQKELLDLKREHDNLIDTFPGNILLSILGRQKIDVVIVTSTRTENSFKTGKDDDVDVFGKKPQPVEK